MDVQHAVVSVLRLQGTAMTHDGNPSLLPLHFILSSLDGAQAGPCNTGAKIQHDF